MRWTTKAYQNSMWWTFQPIVWNVHHMELWHRLSHTFLAPISLCSECFASWIMAGLRCAALRCRRPALSLPSSFGSFFILIASLLFFLHTLFPSLFVFRPCPPWACVYAPSRSGKWAVVWHSCLIGFSSANCPVGTAKDMRFQKVELHSPQDWTIKESKCLCQFHYKVFPTLILTWWVIHRTPGWWEWRCIIVFCTRPSWSMYWIVRWRVPLFVDSYHAPTTARAVMHADGHNGVTQSMGQNSK